MVSKARLIIILTKRCALASFVRRFNVVKKPVKVSDAVVNDFLVFLSVYSKL